MQLFLRSHHQQSRWLEAVEVIERADRSTLLTPHGFEAFIDASASQLLGKYGDCNMILSPYTEDALFVSATTTSTIARKASISSSTEPPFAALLKLTLPPT